MGEFKEKMERQIEEEEKAEIMRRINLYESKIKSLESLGSTENTFLKVAKYFFFCEKGNAEFVTLVFIFVLINLWLTFYIGNFLLSGIVVLSIFAVIWFILIYQNIYVKEIDKYLNRSIYEAMQRFEFKLELEKKNREKLGKEEGV